MRLLHKRLRKFLQILANVKGLAVQDPSTLNLQCKTPSRRLAKDAVIRQDAKDVDYAPDQYLTNVTSV